MFPPFRVVQFHNPMTLESCQVFSQNYFQLVFNTHSKRLDCPINGLPKLFSTDQRRIDPILQLYLLGEQYSSPPIGPVMRDYPLVYQCGNALARSNRPKQDWP